MRSRFLHFIICASALNIGVAHANWQYSGEHTYDMAYYDRGERVSVSLRAGASFAMGKAQNNAGVIVYSYCYDPVTGAFEPDTGECASGQIYAGSASLESMSMSKLSGITFSGGASIGWILPDRPQWRLELGWDHFNEVDYNETPLFYGDLNLSGGYSVDNFDVGSVKSTMATDIISAMAFYDFFEGMQKPLQMMIPYVGLGIGYADTTSKMNFYDQSAELSDFAILQEFGELQDGIIHFYSSETNTINVAAVGAIGVSYGISKNFFFDFGARVSYLPRVKYQLVNSDDTRHMDWFTMKNVIYANIMAGVRFEF